MKHYAGQSCDEVYRKAAKDMHESGYEQSTRTQPTKELRHVTFSVKSPRDRVVFSRPINPAFAIVEVLWIMAGRRDEAYLHFWNPRMSRWANEEGDLRGYGYRLRRHFGIDQLEQAANALRANEDSRQVVLQIWDPREDLPNPNPRSKDVPCNVTSHLMIRDGRLHWLQTMRSNDLIWGTPYNFIQFTVLQDILAGWIGTDIGTYDHISSSLHVYRRHWDHVQTIPEAPSKPSVSGADLRISMAEWKAIKEDLILLPENLASVENTSRVYQLLDEYTHLPEAYRQWTFVLAAEALRRQGAEEDAWELIPKAGEYWAESWERWAKSKKGEFPPKRNHTSEGD